MAIKIFFNLILILNLVVGLFGIQRSSAANYDYDLSIGPSDLRFSKNVFIAGDMIRIYAKVENLGNNDITGYVSFFRGSQLVGNSKSVSVLPGLTGDAFVDFTIPPDSFNIQAKIQGTDPTDQNPANDATQSPLIVPDNDTDGDGTVDRLDPDDDNDGLTDVQEQVLGTDALKKDTDGDSYNDNADAFPLNNREWLDTDHDGIGNNADPDNDNDGWSDSQEQAHGTNPLKPDTDSDGVNDPQDPYPLDPARSKEEASRNIFQPTEATPIQAVQNTNITNVSTLADLQNQLNDLTNTNTAEEKIKNQPLQKFNDVVEKVASKPAAFLRFSNPIIWLFLAIVIVLAAIVFLFFKKRFNKDGEPMINQSEFLNPRQPGTPTPVKNHLTPDRPQVINLKELIKKK